MTLYYVDSSVLVGIITDRSPAAREWFERADLAGDDFVVSRLGEVEIRHQVQNLRGDPAAIDDVLDGFTLLDVDNDLMDEAISVPGFVGGADSIHIASVERLRADNPVLVVHDGQMSRAARALAIIVRDPVTDDPNSPPVAPLP